jgi:hypothetical protein
MVAWPPTVAGPRCFAGGACLAGRLPVIRHFIACERVERSPNGRHYSLINVIHSIRGLPGALFPRIHPELTLFIMMTDSLGSHNFSIQVATWDNEEERSIWETRKATLDMGDDPLKVHGWSFRLRDIWFDRPGLYELRLICNGEIVAREPIRLRESP